MSSDAAWAGRKTPAYLVSVGVRSSPTTKTARQQQQQQTNHKGKEAGEVVEKTLSNLGDSLSNSRILC